MISIIIMLILMAITSVYSRWSCYLSNRHEKNGKRAKRTDKLLDNSLHLLDAPGDEHGMKKDKGQDGGMAWTVSNNIGTMSHKTTTSGGQWGKRPMTDVQYMSG